MIILVLKFKDKYLIVYTHKKLKKNSHRLCLNYNIKNIGKVRDNDIYMFNLIFFRRDSLTYTHLIFRINNLKFVKYTH